MLQWPYAEALVEGNAMRLRAIVSALAAAVMGTALLISAPAVSAAPRDWSMVLEQDTPTLLNSIVIDGHVVAVSWEAVLRDESGRKVGKVFGSQQDMDATPGGKVETRMRTLVFSFPNGQIVAEGIGRYSLLGKLLKRGARSVIAIVGGTGAYAGARGQLLSIHLGDGTHRQKFQLLG